MTAYLSDWMPGQEAMDRIVEAADCAELEAWEAFRDAAADGALAVRMLGPIHGVTPVMRTVADLAEPHPVPIGYWQRAKQSGELIYLTDMHRYQVRRADAERLWPLNRETTGATEKISIAPSKQQRTRKKMLYEPWLTRIVTAHPEMSERLLAIHAEIQAGRAREQGKPVPGFPTQRRTIEKAIERIRDAIEQATAT